MKSCKNRHFNVFPSLALQNNPFVPATRFGARKFVASDAAMPTLACELVTYVASACVSVAKDDCDTPTTTGAAVYTCWSTMQFTAARKSNGRITIGGRTTRRCFVGHA